MSGSDEARLVGEERFANLTHAKAPPSADKADATRQITRLAKDIRALQQVARSLASGSAWVPAVLEGNR